MRLVPPRRDSSLPRPCEMATSWKAGMSPAGFNRAFRSQFGTSPARYVTEMRVREAARCLLQEDGSIDDVAEKTGFPNRAYFSRVFKKVTGEAPAGFRRAHKMSLTQARHSLSAPRVGESGDT